MKQRFTKLLAAFALLVGLTIPMGMWGQTTYNFANIPTTGWSTSGGSQTINYIPWTYSSSTYIGVQSGRIQVGSSKNPQTTAWTIQTPLTSFGNAITVTAVSITAYTTATTATYDISLGGNSVKSGSLTTASSIYSVENLNVTGGDIVVTMTGSSTSKAMYLTNISVTYAVSSTPTCIAPTFNPVSGKVNAGTVVTMSSQTEGATILYSDDDGATWTEGSSYTVNQEVTLKAKATKDGYAESGVSTASYTIRGNAVFTDGLYRELLTTSESFENMQVESVEGDETWVFNSSYHCAFINSEADEIDWLISPKMAVENGKLNISFQIWHKNADNQLFLKWSASNDVNGSWHDLEFAEGAQSGWRTVSNIEIETQDPYVYVAFVYDNTADENAGQYEIKDLQARQYYNVTFNANAAGATGTMDPMKCAAGVATALTNNAFAVSGKAFNGWNTESDGTGDTYVDGGDISITDNITLYAQWADIFIISYTTNGIAETQTTSIIQGNTIEGLIIPTEAYIPAGYSFVGWYNGNDIIDPIQTAPSFVNNGDAINCDMTLKAVFATGESSIVYQKVSGNVSLIANGTYLIAVNKVNSSNYNFANGQAGSGHASVEPTGVAVSDTYSHSDLPEGALEYELIGNNQDGFSIHCSTGYLNATSSKQSLSYGESASETWIFSTKDNGFVLTGATNGSKTSSNSSTAASSIRNYASTGSHYDPMYFFKKNEIATYSNYCTSVTETVELPIAGYTNGGGWNLIASPVVSIDPASAGMITDNYVSSNVTPENGTYDLYRFNQSADLEWENYRVHSFALESGKGYLYASKDGVSIQFAGAPYNSGEIPLVYDAGKDFAGWNLIGNPFGVAATLDIPYYRMNDNQTTLGAKIESGQIAAMEGVFVYAYDAEHEQAIETATFTRAGRSNNASQGFVNLNVEQNASVVDNVIVRFDEGRSLPKLQLFKGSAEIFITKNGKDYAIVNSEAQGEMPVNFKAQENGTYTLNIDTENVEMNYLHLIDNMTGMDVDLLQTPSYTFDANTNDYTSRFRLVFSANNVDGPSTGSGTFAFFSNGNWVVNNEGEATLQVIDVNGRIVSNETINGSVATSINATPGVYMLRLVNGNEVKTQKIVVR